MITKLKRVRNDVRGTSALELALVLPMGMFLALGAIDTSLGYAEKLRVEAAAARAIEQITAFSRVKTDYTATIAEAASAAGVAASEVTVTYWLECNNVLQASFTATCSNSAHQISRYVKVSIQGKFKPVLNFGRFLSVGNDGFAIVDGDASVRVQ